MSYLCFSARVMYQSKTAVSGKTLHTLTESSLTSTEEEEAEEEPGGGHGGLSEITGGDGGLSELAERHCVPMELAG